MFERYTIPARRSIFFALHEAKAFRCPWIMTEHLLLGILSEDETVTKRLVPGALEAIRKKVEQIAPPIRERIPVTTDDLPLSEDSQRALMFAIEEADALGYKEIDAPHLVLGLLRVEGCMAAELLRNLGMEYQRYRESLTN
jgi:ATP-dependent Clp protease ATP-binding subunit ClpC